ncbi:hypothetical protein B0H63DRAFT_249958 [Podospora didyma]|uniref:Uncharacterized protein n=1 Tax=Podospora didyma TaxID=330526 RepID=A0AAE0KL69_9PEZI|nr:hypothetical protein B0H63DRAFT_249958 [Podospora didyma]
MNPIPHCLLNSVYSRKVLTAVKGEAKKMGSLCFFNPPFKHFLIWVTQLGVFRMLPSLACCGACNFSAALLVNKVITKHGIGLKRTNREKEFPDPAFPDFLANANPSLPPLPKSSPLPTGCTMDYNVVCWIMPARHPLIARKKRHVADTIVDKQTHGSYMHARSLSSVRVIHVTSTTIPQPPRSPRSPTILGPPHIGGQRYLTNSTSESSSQPSQPGSIFLLRSFLSSSSLDKIFNEAVNPVIKEMAFGSASAPVAARYSIRHLKLIRTILQDSIIAIVFHVFSKRDSEFRW